MCCDHFGDLRRLFLEESLCEDTITGPVSEQSRVFACIFAPAKKRKKKVFIAMFTPFHIHISGNRIT